MLREKYTGNEEKAITDVDVLFGEDAVDPRPGWQIKKVPLGGSNAPAAHFTLRRGGPQLKAPPPTLRVNSEGNFKSCRSRTRIW
jgi:hypothetical protein